MFNIGLYILYSGFTVLWLCAVVFAIYMFITYTKKTYRDTTENWFIKLIEITTFYPCFFVAAVTFFSPITLIFAGVLLTGNNLKWPIYIIYGGFAILIWGFIICTIFQ